MEPAPSRGREVVAEYGAEAAATAAILGAALPHLAEHRAVLKDYFRTQRIAAFRRGTRTGGSRLPMVDLEGDDEALLRYRALAALDRQCAAADRLLCQVAARVAARGGRGAPLAGGVIRAVDRTARRRLATEAVVDKSWAAVGRSRQLLALTAPERTPGPGGVGSTQ
jgi:hypothetical protein